MKDSELKPTELTQFGFNVEKSKTLRCRVCNTIIVKVHGTCLLGTEVKYGYCKKTSHGASVSKAT